MKYIRTKDGIWQLDNLGCVHHPYNNMPIHKSYLEIIKESDSIEELCDELVEYGNRPIVITQTKVIRGRMSGKTRLIYGAIWTDKGLIYVAKMNDKGELELL